MGMEPQVMNSLEVRLMTLGLETNSDVGVSCLSFAPSARVDEIPQPSLHASTTLEQSKALPTMQNRTSLKVFLRRLR